MRRKRELIPDSAHDAALISIRDYLGQGKNADAFTPKEKVAVLAIVNGLRGYRSLSELRDLCGTIKSEYQTDPSFLPEDDGSVRTSGTDYTMSKRALPHLLTVIDSYLYAVEADMAKPQTRVQQR